MTEKPEEYFKELTEKITAAYRVAGDARSRNKDPELFVEAVPAGDLAARVEGLVGPPGIAAEIKRLGRENITKIIDSILDGNFGMSRDEQIEQAVRTSLAILTEGVVAAPIEGIAKVELNKNPDNTTFLSLYFSGPIRSAGGTAQGLAVLAAAYIQKKLMYSGFRPTNEIIERYLEEIRFYNETVTNLQYVPSDDEIRLIVKNSGVCIDGEPTEKDKEVAVHRDVPGVHTNQIRGGMCLVIAEGMAQKAPKLMKKASEFGIDWSFLSEVEKLKAGKKGKESDEKKDEVKPLGKFMKETVGGRPIFAAPSSKGAFRLRYGRSRASGIAAKSIHPATQVILDDFIATGTQIRVERPGKGCVITPCEWIEGPVVKLKKGDVVRVNSVEYAKKIKNEISEILFLGDILVSYGDFLQANHKLVPSGYCEEWWILELRKAGGDFSGTPTPKEAVEISKKFNVPLHPRYTYHWEDVNVGELKILLDFFSSGETADDVMKVENKKPEKRILELLGIPHVVAENFIIIDEYIVIKTLFDGIEKNIEDAAPDEANKNVTAFEFLNAHSGIKIRKKVGTYIGARMGRPEKAKERKRQPAVQALFPVGEAGGRDQTLNAAAEKETVTVEVSRYECECGTVSMFTVCPDCDRATHLRKICPNQECGKTWSGDKVTCPSCQTRLKSGENRDVNISRLWKNAVKNVGTSNSVKGVKGMISAYKIPEHLEKGILRAKNDVYVFKDGTIRFDATDAPLTHFKPKEVGVSIEYLHKLGYKKDYNYNDLTNENQILELKVQDIVIPDNGADYLIRTAKFVDDLLSKFYGIENFYNIRTREELLGHLVVGLAPHTSAGIMGRVVGFTRARVCYAHPYWHAAKRRNCLSFDTEILVINSGHPKLTTLEDFYDKTKSNESVVDDFGTLQKDLDNTGDINNLNNTKNFETYALNPKTGVFERKKINKIIKTPSPEHLIKIKSKSGRVFTSSTDHTSVIYSNGKVEERKVLELSAGDKLIVPEKINFEENDIKEIDLLEEFIKTGGVSESDIMIRGVRKTVEGCIKKAGGFSQASLKLKINKKTLSNYVYRDSIPLSVLRSLLGLCEKNVLSIPKNCMLGVKRDHTSVPRIININKKFMRLLGYYLSEGHARFAKKSFYQVSFAATEKEIRDDIKNAVKEIFQISPYESKDTISISSRIVYHLFTSILQTGKNAKDKRIPPLFFSMPKEKTRELLSAYFSGDGSVEKGRLHVTCSSVNRELLRDVGLHLLRFGIFYRLKSEIKPAGGIAKKFYDKKGETPNFNLYYLSIRSSYAKKFSDEIGFSLKRKQILLEKALKTEGKPRLEKFNDFVLDEIKEIEYIKSNSDFLYDIEVEDHHNFLVNDFVLSSNCDGDEDTVMLLMDVLLNFSKKFLPESRGGKMDAPLVITTLLDPKEVDDEAHKMEIVDGYPIEFYEKTQELVSPTSVNIKLVGNTLDKNPYSDLRFTHDNGNITGPVIKSRYVTLKTMAEKVDAQLFIAEKVRAIDERKVAEILINSHFLRDTYGNLRAFSRQKFRCVKCNKSYRRVPLVGKCTKCGGRILLTVTEGSVRKYLDISRNMAEKYGLSDYLKQRLMMLDRDIKSLFVNDLSKQASLSDFM